MNFTGVSLRFVDGEDGKYGVVVLIPSHLKVKNVLHKKPTGAVDPTDCLEAVGINLEEKV